MNATLQIALSKNWLTEGQWQEYLLVAKQHGVSVEKELLDSGVASKDELYTALSESLSYYYVKAYFGVKLDESLVSKFKPSEMSGQRFIPIIIKDVSYILVSDAENADRDNRITQVVGDTPQWALCTDEVMDTLQNKFIVPLEMEDLASEGSVETEEINEVQELAKTGQKIPDMVAMIVMAAIDSRASDIQILPTAKNIEIYFKIDGVKTHYLTLEKGILDQMRRVIMKDAQMKEVTITGPAKGKAHYKVGKLDISLRVNMLKTPMGVDINMRVLDNSIYPLDKLGLSPQNLALYKSFFRMSKGFVLVTGPTGSGKSTLLYSGLIDSNVNKRTMMSVEDPIEYVVPGMTQVEINEQEGNTFTEVTKGFLRHNPNVVIVGEIRDFEVANEAFRAAATGHLVFSTLHTNDSVSAISRLLNLGIPGYTIAESLCAVVSQRLIRRVCPKCSYDYTVAESDTELLNAGLEVGDTIKRSKGCDNCHDTGYYGRVAVNELLVIDTRIRELLEEPNVAPTTIRKYVHNEKKVPTLLDDAMYKVRQGVTTFEEIEYMFHEIV